MCVQDYMEMQQNLFVDLLAHEKNVYRRFLSADIKHYLSHITERSIQLSLLACDAALSVTVLVLRTLLFKLIVTLTSVFNLTVLLSYRTICVFLVKKFSYPIATHGHAP